MTLSSFQPITVGRYLVSPLTRLIPDEGHAPSVSIRSGAGSATHDRVLRFGARFGSRDEAARYATAQGLLWLRNAGPTDQQEHHRSTAWPKKS
jgi:hypothetical protein